MDYHWYYHESPQTMEHMSSSLKTQSHPFLRDLDDQQPIDNNNSNNIIIIII